MCKKYLLSCLRVWTRFKIFCQDFENVVSWRRNSWISNRLLQNLYENIFKFPPALDPEYNNIGSGSWFPITIILDPVWIPSTIILNSDLDPDSTIFLETFKWFLVNHIHTQPFTKLFTSFLMFNYSSQIGRNYSSW